MPSQPRAFRNSSIVLVLAAGLGLALPVRACETVDGIMCGLNPPEYGASQGMSMVRDRVGQALEAAWNLANAKNFAAAKAKVQPLEKLSYKSRQEISAIDSTLAFISYSANDVVGITQAFAHSLDAGVVSKAELPSRLAVLTQIYFQTRNYPKAIEMGQRYTREVEPDADILMIVGKAHLVTKDYSQAATAMRAAQDAATAAKIPLKEDWLQFAVTAEFYAHNTAGMVADLEQLQALYPNPKYAADLARYASQNAAAP